MFPKFVKSTNYTSNDCIENVPNLPQFSYLF